MDPKNSKGPKDSKDLGGVGGLVPSVGRGGALPIPGSR